MTARNTGYPQDTIAEEDGVLPEDEDKEQKKKEETETETEVVEDGGGSSAARAGNPEVAEAKVEANGAGSWDKPILRHRRESMSRRVDVMNIQVDAGMLEPAGGEGEEVAAGQVSPSSEVKRGSISPGRADGNRPRTHSWAPAISPPVLSGPFSRTHSRSRSPRKRMSIGVPSFDSFPRLQSDLGRFSTGGGMDRIVALPTEPSGSVSEEWSEGEGVGAAAAAVAAAEEEPVSGPFTDTALVMARLRLPNMELGFEEDGFFGIDVRSLIIGKEIARGAYGVVHEGVLLDNPSEKAEGQKNEDKSVPTEEEGGKAVKEEGAGGDEEEEGEAGAAKEEGVAKEKEDGIDDDAAKGSGEGGAENEKEHDACAKWKEQGTSVAVKIQKVPVDEEEQANLLGELGVLRNHKHPHLVEFIGTAMAMERGADTARIALDMTDGLQYLHQHGIIHRDIKTPNVLIDSSWRAKLCDYNFAIDEKSSIKQDFCAGTAEFMSPEVLLSEDYGLASDVFSLGIIFVEMLTGREPSASFPERPPQTFFVVSEEEIQAELLPEYPPSFSQLQSQCLFPEPADRPTAEDAYNWLHDLVNETGEEEITLPQKGPPLPVLTEGAAIAREGKVINASPKGTDHHWFDSDAMEDQIGSLVENAVDRALAERGQHLGLVGMGDDESGARLDDMKDQVEALRAACSERDNRISDLEVQALRNTSALKMLSSALDVAYKMLEAQQAALSQSNWSANPPQNGAQEEASGGRESSAFGQENEDFDAVEARLSQLGSNS
eukprot:jgi/Undpi1/4972/HiC_scaffold_19.g08324.m1